MQIVNKLDLDLWRQFVTQHPHGNIFHTPEMFQVFDRAKGHLPELWATVAPDGQILALLPLVRITLMDGGLRRFTSRAIAYGSVLCVSDLQGKVALHKLLSAYNQKMNGRILFSELRNLSDLSDLQPELNETCFIYEDHLNFLIDLSQPEEILWRQINKSSRQSIRTSRNKGVIVEEISDRHQLPQVYQLLQQVYSRVKVPLTNPTLFEAAFDILGPQNMFKIFVARLGELYLGACLLLIHNGRIIYWYAGSDRAYSIYTPAEVLIWYVWQWGQAQGCHLFDFGGAGKPDEEYGPRKFKAKFGGTLVNYGRNTSIHAPMTLKLSEMGYKLYRHFL